MSGRLDRVTVSMPYHGSPDTIRRAVDAVLNQTHTNLLLVVVNDGDHDRPPWPALADVTDPRLVRFDLTENRGRYHADAVTLAACTTPWWTVHDADDEAEPQWLETMLAVAHESGADVVFTAQTIIHLDGAVHTEQPRPWTDGRYRHHAHMAGLWDVGFLRRLGGPHPGYRVGFDTMLTAAALASGRAALVPTPLYTRHRRRGSLTTAPATGTRSMLRRRTAAELRRLWPHMTEAARTSPDQVRRVLDSSRLPADRAQVADDAWGLRWPLLVDELADRWTGWALDQEGARLLAERLAERRPRLVVEAGSGTSTVLLAEYARITGARVISLEHQTQFLERTRGLLAEHGLDGHVDVRLAPLQATPAGPWYDTVLPDGVDLVLVDGPPEGAGGRAAALPELLPHLADGAELLLDDADRPGEQAALEQWRRAGAAVAVLTRPEGKAVALVHPHRPSRAVDASDTVVTVLCGRRPDLLEVTLATLRATAPGLLDTAHVIVLHNGADPETGEVVDRHRGVVNQVITTTELLTCGQGTSRLAEAAAASGRRFWLHLEDDWEATTAHPGWLDDARHLLDTHPRVYQVRLRHTSERVLPYHMVTRRPLVWEERVRYRVANEAHLTLNPSLTRVEHITRVWPAVGEREAQRNAHRAGLRGVAQLVPGVFTHKGENQSLRLVTGSPT